MAVKIRSLAQVEAENPDLFRAMMKHHNPARFVLVSQVIISFPRGNECHVYGIFTIDKEMLRSGGPGAPVIKQDFLVFEPGSDPARAIYYTECPSAPTRPTSTSTGSANDLARRTMAAGARALACAAPTTTTDSTRWIAYLLSPSSARRSPGQLSGRVRSLLEDEKRTPIRGPSR